MVYAQMSCKHRDMVELAESPRFLKIWLEMQNDIGFGTAYPPGLAYTAPKNYSLAFIWSNSMVSMQNTFIELYPELIDDVLNIRHIFDLPTELVR